MAGRRCFSDKVVESSAFLSLPENAQTLYFHLNMAADDDGFINNASRIITGIKGGKAALNKLVESRFLLEFGYIYVVKHWRISNSLKNDRLKPLTYDDIAGRIWVKPNKAYTDHPVNGCRTLLEMKTGIHLESTWNPNLTEPNLTELNRTKPNLTEPNQSAGGFDEIWNDYPELRRGSRKEAETAWTELLHSDSDGQTAIANLASWKASAQWAKDGGQYIPYLVNWISRGLWQQAPEAAPSMYGCGNLGDAEMEAIRRVLSQNFDED